jgi:hypothetical protein
MSVTVFGGASPRPGEPAYAEAEKLGRILGSAGCKVITGGYIGTMEAISKGAAQTGGHVVGVTCDEIERWRQVAPNPYLHQEVRCVSLAERMNVLIRECAAAIALPGGVGTLAEILYLWNHLVIHAIPAKPLVLVGPEWQTVVETFFSAMPGYNPEAQQAMIQFAPDVAAAARIVLGSSVILGIAPLHGNSQ